MAEIQPLDTAAAATGLRTAPGGARGFLGLDPVTQNDALLRQELVKLGAQVFRGGNAVLGYLPNPDQPRQAVLATTSAEVEPLQAFLAFLRTYQRCTSYVSLVPVGAPAVTALQASGFSQVGTLRNHYFQQGKYLDVGVYYANGASACPS